MKRGMQTRDRLFMLKWWHLALAILAAVVGLTGLYFAVQKNNVERRLEALRAAGYPTDFAGLAEYNKLPVGTPNAAAVYRLAFWQYQRPADEEMEKIPLVGTALLPGRGLPLPQTMTDAISAYLASNQSCLALLHEAGAIEQCRYSWDYSKWLTDLSPIRSCIRLLELSAIYHAYTGDPNTAVADIGDGLRLADSLRNEPGLVCHLHRVAFLAVTLHALERSMNAAVFTDPQLQELNQALAGAAATFDFTQVLIMERCFMLESCRNPALMSRWQAPTPRGVPANLLTRLPGMRRIGIVDTLDRMEDCIAASKLPPRERLARFRELEQETRDLSFVHVMVKNVLAATEQLGELHRGFPAAFGLARTAVAIERYRLATGRLPEELGRLVPQYLDQVPTDPFDGQPLRYRRTDPGYVVYNVAGDGQDNGGAEPGGENQGKPYDWCFTVAR